MANLEKVIRGLECLSRLAQDGTCAGCAYFRPFTDDPDTGWCDRTEAAKDALALLREKEPIEPIVERINELDSLFRCGGCGAYVLFRKQRYCHACGREVKWDG